MSENTFVTAVVVSHDGATWLTEGIAAIFSQSRPIDRIIAVDTGSQDNSVDLLRRAGIDVVSAPRDMGFGDAVILALEHAEPISQSEDEFIWILHDDCAPQRSALEILISEIADKPNVAFIGPKLRGWSDRNHLLEVGISIAGNGARWTGLEYLEQDQGQHDDVREVLSVSSAALLARRSIFMDLGGFDPNLALFRDDVDLGWRARVAGFSVLCAPRALVFHAEASASERRTVDVSEAFLHRPHLLDRRNAAYVILVNSPWWQLPMATIRLLSSAFLRALLYLVAKLPGYASDEIVAVGYLFLKPGEMIVARKERRSKRLLPNHVIKPFLPPFGSQIRVATERISAALSARFSPPSEEADENDPISYSDIGTIDPNFDEPDLVLEKKSSRWRSLANRPLLAMIIATFVISLISSRSRLGALSGGALPIAPHGALDLLRKYAESWHLVGMGSGAPTPPWVGITGLLSVITLGNLSLFISLIFLLTPPLASFVMYRALKRSGLHHNLSIVGGAIYAFSPVIWNSVTEGRVGTIAVALLLPLFISLSPIRTIEEKRSWRRVYNLSLIASIISAFAADFLLGWSVLMLVRIGEELLSRRSEIRERGPLTFFMTADLDIFKRKLAFFFIPWILNFPWSASLIFHPTQFLMAPGIPIESAGSGFSFGTLLLNSGGSGSLPIWIISPFFIYAVITFVQLRTRTYGAAALALMGIALALSHVHITSHGSAGSYWPGTIFVLIEIFTIAQILQLGFALLDSLKTSHVNYRHLISALAGAITIISVVLTSVWAITGGAQSPVQSNRPQVVPAFIASLNESPSRPKTLVIRKVENRVEYFISRGLDLELGDPDVTVPIPPQLESAINEVISGAGISSSKVIGAYGIQYVYMKNPADEAIVRTIDGIGGFARSSASSAGVVWKVVGSSGRLSELLPDGSYVPIKANDSGGEATLTSPGKVRLAEKYDRSWKLLSNGVAAKLSQSEFGVPVFQVSQPGPITLLHDGTMRRAFLSIQLLGLLLIIILGLPAGRRRSEVPAEEIA